MAPRRGASAATPGVGRTPRSTTSAPPLAAPAHRAQASISPESRVSRPTRILPPKAPEAASPRRRASSGRRPLLATPRTPSVPNVNVRSFSWPPLPHSPCLDVERAPFDARKEPDAKAAMVALALGELRTLAGLLEAVLLALDGPRVTGEHSGGLQFATGLLRFLGEGPGYAVAQGLRLSRGTTAFDLGDDLVAAGRAEEFERRAHRRAVRRPREVLIHVTAVHGDITVTGEYPHPCHGRLAPSRPDVQSLCHLLHLELLWVLSGVGVLGARVDLQLLELLA